MIDPLYPFDPLGTLPSNKIENEVIYVSIDSFLSEYLIIPNVAPYYSDSLVITNNETGEILVEGIDYIKTHRFKTASETIGKPIYGSIVMLDITYSAYYTLEYSTLGGDWLIDNKDSLTTIYDSNSNPRITLWESVVNLPYQFPVINHEFSITDLKGLDDLILTLEELRLTIENKPSAVNLINIHKLDTNNPHNTTPLDIGLGNVPNYPPATLLESQAGLRNDRVMTPSGTKALIDRTIDHSLFYTKAEVDQLLLQLKNDILNGV